MAVQLTRSTGMLLLGLWLILSGLLTISPFPLPPLVMGVIALIAGVLILVGR